MIRPNSGHISHHRTDVDSRTSQRKSISFPVIKKGLQVMVLNLPRDIVTKGGEKEHECVGFFKPV